MLLWMIYDACTNIPFALRQNIKQEDENAANKRDDVFIKTEKKKVKKNKKNMMKKNPSLSSLSISSSSSSSSSSSWGMFDVDTSHDKVPFKEDKFPRSGSYDSLIRCSPHY